MDAAENVIARTPNEMLGVNRTALIDTLTGVLPEGCVELNQCVRSLDDSGDDVGVQLDDGSADRFTLVVGADGLHSQIGELLFGSPALAYRGYRAWRTVVQRPLETPAQVVFRHREGVAVGTYPISDQQFYVFALEHGPDDLSANSEPWRHLQRILQTMGPQANGLAGRLSRAVPVIYTPIYEVVRERWHRGRVVLIGDAAHAVTPNGAQGAAMAMEDAVVLAECLANPNDTPEALSEFEARRLPRLQTVRDIVRFGGMSQGLEGRLPDEAMERHPGNVPNAQQVIIQGAL
jgi:2-polyprenyl-6-methoxyphenol hydroxylase-like FAD-dependent oxidoreductase